MPVHVALLLIGLAAFVGFITCGVFQVSGREGDSEIYLRGFQDGVKFRDPDPKEGE